MSDESPYEVETDGEAIREAFRAIEKTAHDFANTQERARLVRMLRVDFDCTWRSVAAHVAYVYPDSGIPKGHQFYGEALCRAAAKFLNEDPNMDPWN